MWFKKVLLGCSAVSSALTIVTASVHQDAFVSKSQHVVERLVFPSPSLQHRQEDFGNRTSTAIPVSSATTTTSSVFETPNIPQTSDAITTPPIIIIPGPTSSTTIEPISSTTKSSSAPTEPSSSDGNISSASEQISTSSTTLQSSATSQETPEISSPSPVPSSSETSEVVTSSTTPVPSSTISSVIGITSSSILETPSSTGPVNEPTPVPTPVPTPIPTSEIVTSPEPISSSVLSSASSPPAETSQTLPDVPVPSSAIESASSTTPALTSQLSTTVSDIVITSTPDVSTTEPIASTSVEQQPIPSSSTTPNPSSILESSTSHLESLSSSVLEASTSLPQESATVPPTDQTPTPTPTPAPSSEVGQSSSFPEPQLPSSSTTENAVSSFQTPLPSVASSSTLADLSSVVETPILPSSIADPISTPVPSIVPTPSASTEGISSSVIAQSSEVSSIVLNPTAPPFLSSTESIAGSSTLGSTIPTSIPASEQLPSSSSFEVVSSLATDPGLSSSIISLGPTAPPMASTTTPVMESLSSIVSGQTGLSPSETNEPSSLFTNFLSSQSVGVPSSGSTLILTPTPTIIESESSATTLQQSTPLGSIGTGVSSSLSLESTPSFSLMPSETPATSVQDSAVSMSSTSTGSSEFLSSPVSTPSNTQSNLPGQSLTFTTTPQESSFSSLISGSQIVSSVNPTSVSSPPSSSSSNGPIPTSESTGSVSGMTSLVPTSTATPTFPDASSFASTGAFISTSLTRTPLVPSVVASGTQIGSNIPTTSGTVTATFSTVYISSFRSSVIDLSTVAFSLLSSVTGAAVNQTAIQTSDTTSFHMSSATSGIRVPASESLASSSEFGTGANVTRSTPMQSSTAATTGLPGDLKSTRTSSVELGITFSRSVMPTGVGTSISPSLNATEAETLQTTSMQRVTNSTSTGVIASTTLESASSARTDESSSMSASDIGGASTTSNDKPQTPISSTTPSGTPSKTPDPGSPPPLTTSQTAGVAVGATTGLLIAVVAAVFIARRYHGAKQGKRMSTGSVYPKVAYLYDPKTGGDGGDTEALMPGGTGGPPPAGPASRMTQGSPKYMQRHSTGTFPVMRFTSPGNPFAESVRDPAVHRYSEYARLDTAQALSAAVAGYGAARRSSTYTKHPSQSSNPFSDHVIPSPTFAPFSPDDIRRPELKRSPNLQDLRGQYSPVSTDSYAYLNTAASMYPPVSPYGRPSSQGPSPYSTGRQSVDSDPFSDPFEHDVLLHIDERNRTSDSVTIFAPSPNLMPPRTPRTPVGPKLPIKHANGMTSARSLLSPVAAKYIKEAQKVKIPRKSVASPVLVQVGRSSPVIKPFSPPPAAPEHRGWDDIKRQSEKHFSDEQSVPAPLKFASPVIKRKPVSTSHTQAQPSLTGAGETTLAGNFLPLAANMPTMHNKSVGLEVPGLQARPGTAPDAVSEDPIVREKRSRELRFADPTLIGKEF